MNHFEYTNEILHAEGVSLQDIAQQVGTPFYCYSTATIERHYRVFKEAFPPELDVLVAYSVKANSNVAVLKTLARQGSGADVVSGGELLRALRAGIAPDKIVFSGVGKTDAEMALGLEHGIALFNVESMEELELLHKVALQKGKKAPVALRINPDIDAKTHAKISTGKKEDKFGIPWEWAIDSYRHAATLSGIDMRGIDAHIGSQITELEPFEAAFKRLLSLVDDLRGQGLGVSHLDLGGGLGVPYNEAERVPPLPQEYGALVGRLAKGKGLKLVFEPGRLIVANAGLLVAKVLFVKQGQNRKFLILDAGMNDLIRPTLYNAYHAVAPVVRDKSRAEEIYDIVGPVCETGDTFAKERPVQQLTAGDLVAFRTAGAYGAVQASEYNTRPLVPEVLVNGDRFAVIRQRPDIDTIVARDHVPAWLEG